MRSMHALDRAPHVAQCSLREGWDMQGASLDCDNKRTLHCRFFHALLVAASAIMWLVSSKRLIGAMTSLEDF